jgi:hypothetical protein
MKKALLVCYGGGHANLIAPLHQRLLEEGRVESTVLALSVGKGVFERERLPFKTLAYYESLIMDADADRYGRELADRWHVDSSGLTRRESEIYLGAAMRDLAVEIGEAQARRRLDVSGRRAFLPLASMTKIVEAERPDVIVATNSPRYERAATLVGNKRGIPTLNIHDDLGFFPREYTLSADAIAVMSEITKENLVAQGHDGSKIVVTGHPAFDRVPDELRAFDRVGLVRKFGLPPGPYVILGTSQPGRRGEIVPMCPQVCDAVAAVGGLHLIIKPHPGEDADAYRAFAASRKNVTVVTGVNIRELLFIGEMLITFASTIMIESILMGKPIISYNLTSEPDPLPFVRWGLGIEATRPDALKAAVQSILSDPGFRARFTEARSHYFSNAVDGQATRRVADLIYRLAGLLDGAVAR